MDNDKLDQIHNEVRKSHDSLAAKLDEHTKLHHENIQTQTAIARTLISLRDNTWHQYKQMLDRFAILLGWHKKGD